MGIILIYNFILFSLIIWRLITMQNNKKFEHKSRKIRVFGIVGLFFLFGLSWGLPIFAIDEVAEVFTYLFTVLITFQGMFIFIFYCIYKKDTRQIICLHVCNRKKGVPRKVMKDKSSSTGNTGYDTREMDWE
uniref:G-protein coupled receptors family 2 profile 2 domain-containing protein n=1 Tax=Octopus bimaculoides TaxID=37653 RepID=A0A0L8FU63_OCTBM